MVILIAGTSHTGKTLLAQKLLEKFKYPYLSIDHLKMGLIRSKNTNLNVENDEKLTEYLWKIIKEIIKTNIENKQNIIIEGCYIPYEWKKDFLFRKFSRKGILWEILAVGITFAFFKVNIIIAVSMIGIITFILSLIGVKIGNRFEDKFQNKAELMGGIILIIIGLKILLEHLEILTF